MAWLLTPQALADDAANLDRVVLKNGSTIFGTVTAFADGKLAMDTDFAGSVSIDQTQIVSLHSEQPRVLQMTDGTVREAQPLRVENELLVVSGETIDKDFTLEDLTKTDPEDWELGIGYKWTGLVNFAWVLERGNTDTDELDHRLDTTLQGDDDRYTLRFNGEVDEANGVKNADNWTLIAKYDHFLEDRWYWGVLASAEQDEFADLDLRSYFGPYMGRQLLTEPALELEAELGLVWVTEDFLTAPDNEYPGANWNIHAQSNYLGGDSRLYVDHLGIWDLDNTDDIILNTTFGLAFPLLFGPGRRRGNPVGIRLGRG